MSDNKNFSTAQLLSFSYGSEQDIEKDVDLFADFYTEHYGKSVSEKLINRKTHSYKKTILLSLFVAICFLIPVFLVPSSIWAWIILVLIFGPIAIAVMNCRHLANIRKDSNRAAETLLRDEYESAKQKWKRIFSVSLYDNRIVAEYVLSKPKQCNSRFYDEVKAVYETDDLFFIQGLTWFSKFLLSEEQENCLRDILKLKCEAVYRDETLGSSNKRAACIGHDLSLGMNGEEMGDRSNSSER